MSYSEILWVIATIIVMFVAIYSIGDVVSLIMGGSFMFLTGLVISSISSNYTEFVTTAEVEMIPKYQDKTLKGLTVLGDNNIVYEFVKYEDIIRLEDDGKFYKLYEYKQCFGPDEHQMRVIIK